jgi:hypothetical protein
MKVASHARGKRDGGEEFDAEFSLGTRLGAYGKEKNGLEGWKCGHLEDGVWVEGEDESEEHWTQEHVESDEAEVEACMACDVEPLEESTWNDTEAVAVKVNTTVGAVTAILDTACFSTWFDELFFERAGGTNFAAGVFDLSADGGKLRVAGSGTLDFCLWSRLFTEQAVRVMKQLPAIMLIGRQFMEMHSMSLDLGRGLGELRWIRRKVR